MPKLYATIFNLVALFVVFYIGVDLFYRIVRAQLKDVDTQEIAVVRDSRVRGHKGPALKDYRAITDRNLFHSLENDSETVKPTIDIDALPPTKLRVALLGTVMSDPQGAAVAVIEERNKNRQGLFRVGDSVQHAIVKEILRGTVVLRVNDKDEVLTMEESFSKVASSPEIDRPARALSPPRRQPAVTLRRSDILKSLEDVNTLLSQARVRPHFTDGNADGLAFSHIKAGSLFSKMGLRDGDIVQGIDGRPIKSPDDVLSFYENMRSGSQISIQIDRKGQKSTLDYELR